MKYCVINQNILQCLLIPKILLVLVEKHFIITRFKIYWTPVFLFLFHLKDFFGFEGNAARTTYQDPSKRGNCTLEMDLVNERSKDYNFRPNFTCFGMFVRPFNNSWLIKHLLYDIFQKFKRRGFPILERTFLIAISNS